MLVLAAAVLFALLPGALSEAADFRAARPCSEVSAPENGDCLSEWPATVVSTGTGRSNKAVTHWVTVDLSPEEPSFRIRMRGDGPVWRNSRPATGSPCSPGATWCGSWAAASCARTPPGRRTASPPSYWPWGSPCWWSGPSSCGERGGCTVAARRAPRTPPRHRSSW
ncbi:hypothetical protein V6574_22795 [Streptomyces sp. SM1P]